MLWYGIEVTDSRRYLIKEFCNVTSSVGISSTLAPTFDFETEDDAMKACEQITNKIRLLVYNTENNTITVKG